MAHDEHQNFKTVLLSSDLYRARWEAVCARIADASEITYAIRLTPEDTMNLAAAKLATMTDSVLDSDTAMQEALRLPKIAARLAQATEKAGIQAGTVDLSHLSRPARMTLAREMGLTGSEPVKPKLDPVEREYRMKLLLSLSPGLRIAKAREWGMA